MAEPAPARSTRASSVERFPPFRQPRVPTTDINSRGMCVRMYFSFSIIWVSLLQDVLEGFRCVVYKNLVFVTIFGCICYWC